MMSYRERREARNRELGTRGNESDHEEKDKASPGGEDSPRLISRVQIEEYGEIEVNKLYETYKFELIESGHENVSSQTTFRDYLKFMFPEIKRARKKINESNQTVYRGLSLKPLTKINVTDIEFSNIPDVKPSFCNVKCTSDDEIVFEMDSGCTSNGNRVCKTLKFNKDLTFEVSVADREVDLRSMNVDTKFHLNRMCISFVFCIVNKITLCNGMKLHKSLVVSRFHTLDMWKVNGQSFKSLRHTSCSKVVHFNSKTLVCRICQKMTMYYNKENCNEKKAKIQKPDNMECNSKTDELVKLFPNAPKEMISMLLEQSVNVSKHPNGRRWSKDFIVTCLQLYNRSPKCYELLQESKLMVLPSKSVLILYRNALKQDPGFDPQTFEWMNEEANRRGLSDNERLGGVIFDEMAIQQDIQLEKNGSVLEMTGFTDLGEEGDMCFQLRKGATKKTMGTHVLQLLFLGLNGFRFPFAYFVTDTVQASELYALFWKAVAHLYTFGFRVMFTCMDGAQSNRSFMHICLGNKPNIYSTPSPCTSQRVIFMMDISHVLKKIRNNILKSGIHKQCTRLLTLPSMYQIQWQMFIDFFRWDQQNGLQLHRKLTNEHLFPDSQLKMRNYLAEDILNKEMVHAMKIYRQSLGEKGQVLNGAIELLEQTSVLVTVFRGMKPIREINDDRLIQLKVVDDWFGKWEMHIQQSNMLSKEKSKCLLSHQCLEDIHSCIQGFTLLCEDVLKKETCLYVTPAIINSDVIENIFNQQRSTYNGANTNPTVLQYKKSINNILVGQTVISKKANAGAASALPFTISVSDSQLKKRKTPPTQQKSELYKNIKVIRM